ncbi:MAG: hypothetical protein H3Z53_05920 [archaeon]|nr:hypothetical protein [archaeon]MCP8313892.1 hypothetical protein [archaeon]
MTVEARVLELERRVSILSRALYLILFEEGELLPKSEIDDLKKRLNEYRERRDEFTSLNELLKDVQSNTAQESHK